MKLKAKVTFRRVVLAVLKIKTSTDARNSPGESARLSQDIVITGNVDCVLVSASTRST